MTQFTVTRLGHHGDGIVDGPVFAPLTLPGETVAGHLAGDRLEDIRIVMPSPDRVAPPCRHFPACGGCQLQHASETFLSRWKTDVVKAALRAVGLTVTFLPVHVSPEKSRRRAKFTARRTRKGVSAGFLGRGSDRIVDIPDCRLLCPPLMQAMPLAGALAQAGGSRKHPLAVTVTLSLEGLDVAVTGGKPLDQASRKTLAEIAQTRDLARLFWDDEPIAQRRPPVQSFDGIRVVLPPGAFLQATQPGESALRDDVRQILGQPAKVIDLFAGCGTFALPLSRMAQVHAVEGDSAMMAALDSAWRGAEGVKTVTCETRDLFRNPLIHEDLRGFDAAIIDPPRAGAEAQTAELAKARIPKIAYVSCNPATFARDARTLVMNGYALDRIRVVDQFRWSTHVELVAGFTFNSA